MARTVKELREYADDHLLYEIQMASGLAARMSRHAALFDNGLSAGDGPMASEVLELVGRNSDIESFVLHAGNLVDFLYPNKPKHADVVATSYFDNAHDWTCIRPSRPKSLENVNQRVPIEVGHLSFSRVKRKDKTWKYREMWRDLAKVIETFVDKVPEERLSEKFRAAAKASLPTSLEDLAMTVSSSQWVGLTSATSTTSTATMYPSIDIRPSTGGTAVYPPSSTPEPPPRDD
jgi:hypothetical protein